ncbi:MAG: hypothetical protein MUF19_03330 [Candidatus Pacebacteria bacterium]|jgi:hypothetical protein|nr:hypothetical protein [Candidatus Paceibacterota bacterium]
MTLFSQSWRIPTVLCALVIAAYSFVSVAFANETDVEILQMQMMTLQTGLQLLQGGSMTNTSATNQSGCTNAQKNYTSGSVIPGLTLNNGAQSSVPGFQYRCTSGRWIFEKASTGASIIGTSTGTSDSTSSNIRTCSNNKRSYKEGARLSSITIDGKRTKAADGVYVCRSGQWSVEARTSSQRGSSASSTSGCRGLNKMYREGDTTLSILTKPFDLKSASNTSSGLVQCKGGKWIPASSVQKQCKLGLVDVVNHGAVSANPYKTSKASPLDSFWNRFGPYTCTNGVWVPKAVGCSYDGTAVKEGGTITAKPDLETLRNLGNKNFTPKKLTCRNGQLQ